MNLFGFESEKHEDVELKEKELIPYKKVHYLLSFDINIHDEILALISPIKARGDVEIESTLN